MQIQVILTIIVGVFESLLYAGSIYGWASLQPILIEEGFFSSNCPSNTTGNATTGNCKTQVEELNLVFTIITSIPPVIAIGFGYILDRYGNWITRTLILMVYFVGIIVTAIATSDDSWILFISLSLCNLAGYGLLFANLAIGNLVPRYRASIVTLMSGAFDSGTLTFLVFYELYKIGVSFSAMFYFYAGLIALFVIQTFFLTPKGIAPYVLPKNYVYGYKEMKCFKDDKDAVEGEAEKNYQEFEEHQDDDNPDNLTLKDCFKEIYTWTELLHYLVVHFAVTYFIGSFNSWIETKVDKDSIDLYTTVFGIFQGLGIIFAPFSGLLIDYCRRRFTKTIGLGLASIKSVTVLLFINDFLVIFMLVLSLIPNAEVQYLTMALQVISRAFVYSTAAAFANAVYPTRHFGVIYGITEAAGGVVLLLQYPVTLLLTRVLDDNFQIVNGVLLALSVIILAHPIYIMKVISRRAAKRKATGGEGVEKTRL